MTPSLHSSTAKILVAASVALGVVLIAAAVAFYLIVVKAPTELAHKTVDGIKEVFNFTPRVRIDQTIVMEQSAPIAELATVSKGVFVDHTWSHTWMGSTKTIEIQGTFTAKGGFDLRQPFTISVVRNPLRVLVDMPPARLLSVQLENYRVVRDEDGLWNRLTGKDREMAVSELNSQGKARAESSGLLEEVRSTAQTRIREIVERNGAVVEFTMTGEPR